jgi:DNA-3-methyladenine glycosylase I
MAKIENSTGDDKQRCEWCLKDDLYMNYHDEEWGIPSHDDSHLFEHLILETFQAGLSWYTILKKRENFRRAFRDFDPNYMAAITEVEIDDLMKDPGIIRSRAKILAAVNNAKCFLRVQKEFGSFDKYIWSFTGGKTLNIEVNTRADVQTTREESDAMAKDMKSKGFKFVGSTTCMAYMEAIGMVNDHFTYCWKHR